VPALTLGVPSEALLGWTVAAVLLLLLVDALVRVVVEPVPVWATRLLGGLVIVLTAAFLALSLLRLSSAV